MDQKIIRDFIFWQQPYFIGEFDWKQKGKKMYHFIYPPQPEVNDGAYLIIEDKLVEAIKRAKALKRYKKLATELILKTTKDKQTQDFLLDIVATKLQEFYFIQKWIWYWTELARINKSYIPKKVFAEKITDDDIARAKQFPIERLVGGHPRRSGRNLMCLCPFHEERTPSFHIYVEQNTYHCFGCGANGDSIRFVMEKENLPFVEAVRSLL